MKKVHMCNNKLLANPTSTNKIITSYGVCMVLDYICPILLTFFEPNIA